MEINDIVNCWLLSREQDGRFAKHFQVAGYVLNATVGTEVVQTQRGITIVGFCVDSHGEIALDEIPEYLSVSDLSSFIARLVRMAGSYVIFRETAEGLQVFGDATHFMSVFYGSNSYDERCCAAYEFLVAEALKLPRRTEADEIIRNDYDIHRILVGDLTVYESVFCLLPNHYLDFSRQASRRYFPRVGLKKVRSRAEAESIIDATLQMAKVIMREYGSRYDLLFPLTSGYDSRLIVAIACSVLPVEKIECYTSLLAHLDEKSPDVSIPRQIVAGVGLRHHEIRYMAAPEEQKEFLKRTLGDSRQWDGDYEWTMKKLFPGKAAFNGQLVGQIGKSSVGNNIPEWMATSNFLLTKQRNTSSFARTEMYEWFKVTRPAAHGYSMFDLWGWEFRCGRWNANSISSCAANGLMRINCFNCTEMLAEWCRIPRAWRFRKFVHVGMLKRLDGRFLKYPFNPHEKWSGKVKSNPIAFWLGSWGKYWLAGLRLSRNKNV